MINIKVNRNNLKLKFDKSKLKPKDDLFQGIWIGDTINPEVSERLIEIADSVIKSMKITAKISDIIITGSIAGYNWHELSDIDLHILLDFSEIDDNFKLVKRMLDQSRINWNKAHDILIAGKEVEIYFQDKSEPHESNGIWSLLNDKWLAQPVHLKMDVDLKNTEKKAEAIAMSIEHIEEMIKSGDFGAANEYASKLKKKISRMRSSGLSREGIYSPENLAFKMLRNHGWLGRLSDAKIESYDKMMSLQLDEVRDYFNNNTDEDYMKYSDHPMSSIENLMNPDMPAPWEEEYEGEKE